MGSVVFPNAEAAGDERAGVGAERARPATSEGVSFTTLFLRAFVWGPAAVLILSAFAVTGGIALFLVPLAGLFYAVFCFIAWNGPDERGEANGK